MPASTTHPVIFWAADSGDPAGKFVTGIEVYDSRQIDWAFFRQIEVMSFAQTSYGFRFEG
ncbi:MAG: hypothetical protein ACO3NZ_11485 [Pirellulales bacterium]